MGSALRFPPYHPDLNPIQLSWAIVKDGVTAKHTAFELDDAIHLTKEMFVIIIPQEWCSGWQMSNRRCSLSAAVTIVLTPAAV
jgi:hypothetical protein